MASSEHPLRVVILGGVAWNTMVYLDDFPPPVPGTIFSRGSYETAGSSGAGKALNHGHLGADVTLWGLLGDDDAGRRVQEFIGSHGIDFVTEVDPAGTMRHINLMDNTGERISIFANPGSFDIEIDTAAVADQLRAADLVSVTIMNYCRQFLPMLKEIAKPVSVDIHDYDGVNPYHGEFIAAADYLFMNSLELDAWRPFLEQQVDTGTTVTVCTHGSEGASGLTSDSGWVEIPAAPIDDVVDTNGAGDAFHAGFMTSWLETGDLETAMRRGTDAAAAAVQSPDLSPSQ